jgi:UDP-N-acetyl-D-glucosamine dehydrogenase
LSKTRKYQNLTEEKSVKWQKNIIATFDAVLISTAHSEYNYKQLAEWNDVIIDTRNSFKNLKISQEILWKA